MPIVKQEPLSPVHPMSLTMNLPLDLTNVQPMALDTVSPTVYKKQKHPLDNSRVLPLLNKPNETASLKQESPSLFLNLCSAMKNTMV